VEPFTYRILRRPAGIASVSRASTQRPGRSLDVDVEQFAGRWIALLDRRVIANDETPAGLIRKVWESPFSIDEVQIQYVEGSSPVVDAAKVS
jgi:hypothetical protein